MTKIYPIVLAFITMGCGSPKANLTQLDPSTGGTSSSVPDPGTGGGSSTGTGGATSTTTGCTLTLQQYDALVNLGCAANPPEYTLSDTANPVIYPHFVAILVDGNLCVKGLDTIEGQTSNGFVNWINPGCSAPCSSPTAMSIPLYRCEVNP